MKALRYLIPLAIFGVLVIFLWRGLSLNPREVPSPLIDKPTPVFNLPVLGEEKTFRPEEMKGKVWLLNVWASWCVSCRQEHPVLVKIARQQVLPVIGLNYKEVRGDGEIDMNKVDATSEARLARERAARWLKQHGDPYALSVLDLDGRVGVDFGVYGVPETFLIDREGRIRYKHIGPLTDKVWNELLLPKVKQLTS
ncbi:Thiol:disulfide interchange protein DsbE [Burkholderiales bacterium]|nr:MAG: DsbE family thiol:disulfide interchange protein [Burkholderiales bacterium]CAG1001822.1 Thiol:disulfide interchange protein DsbE [Burkholderiales bacterium]